MASSTCSAADFTGTGGFSTSFVEVVVGASSVAFTGTSFVEATVVLCCSVALSCALLEASLEPSVIVPEVLGNFFLKALFSSFSFEGRDTGDKVGKSLVLNSSPKSELSNNSLIVLKILVRFACSC